MRDRELQETAGKYFAVGACCMGLVWLFFADYPHSWKVATSPGIVIGYTCIAVWLIGKRLLTNRVHQPIARVGIEPVELNCSNWGSVWKRWR